MFFLYNNNCKWFSPNEREETFYKCESDARSNCGPLGLHSCQNLGSLPKSICLEHDDCCTILIDDMRTKIPTKTVQIWLVISEQSGSVLSMCFKKSTDIISDTAVHSWKM